MGLDRLRSGRIGDAMWPRVIGGVVLALIGILWIAQGLGAAKGSGMSGHPIYALLGLVVAIIGIWLIRAGLQRRDSKAPSDPVA
jgi:hypothetical protein